MSSITTYGVYYTSFYPHVSKAGNECVKCTFRSSDGGLVSSGSRAIVHYLTFPLNSNNSLLCLSYFGSIPTDLEHFLFLSQNSYLQDISCIAVDDLGNVVAFRGWFPISDVVLP